MHAFVQSVNAIFWEQHLRPAACLLVFVAANTSLANALAFPVCMDTPAANVTEAIGACTVVEAASRAGVTPLALWALGVIP